MICTKQSKWFMRFNEDQIYKTAKKTPQSKLYTRLPSMQSQIRNNNFFCRSLAKSKDIMLVACVHDPEMALIRVVTTVIQAYCFALF